MTDFDSRIQSVLVKTAPLPTGAGCDWDNVLARAEASTRSAHTRRMLFSLAFATLAAVVVAATPLGAAIAHGFGDFSGWLGGRTGTPVSKSERRAVERNAPLSWELFPRGAKLRRLITLSREGIEYRLYGYRAGDVFCLRLTTLPALLTQTSCAPESDLISKREPVLPLYVDAPVVAQKKTDGWSVPVKKSSVTFGIVSDGVTSVRGRTRAGALFGVVASDSFLIINPGTKTGHRVRSISARDAAGDMIAIPLAGPPKSIVFDNGALGKPPAGAAFRMAKRQINGVKIGWLARHEKRGTAVPRNFPDMESGTTFQRLLAPEPGPLRVMVSLHRNDDICMSIMSPTSGAADGGGCLNETMLNSGGWGDVSTAHFLWRESVMLTEGDQYVTNAGLVDDHVSRMLLLFVSGKRVPVPVKDNAFSYMVPRTEYPVLLLAYDSEGRIIGTERDNGRDVGFVYSETKATKIPPKTAQARRGKSRAFPRVRTIPGGVITEWQADPIVFEQSKLIHEFTQSGQSFYDVIVLLKNRSSKTAVAVIPELATRPRGNNGTSGIVLNPIATILPHSESLLVYPAFGVPTSLKNRVDVGIESYHPGRAAQSPVSFSQLRYSRSTGSGVQKCTISGVVSNRFTKKRNDLKLNAAGFVSGRLVSGGFTALDTVFPGRDAAFSVDLFKAAACPIGLDRIRVFPNLSQDEIYNP